jgi:putative aldouronate transport system permease protein
MSSLTDEKCLMTFGYSFIPRKFSFEAYEYIIKQSDVIFRAYGITILTTVVGTAASLLISSLLAYPLSRKDFKQRNAILFFVFFTMLFNGGLVPSYIMWTQFFQIKNTLFAYIIPGLLVNAFNIILMKNYFSNNIPDAVIEAAQIDCAGEFKIFFSIVIPLSLPILATLGLLTALRYWNDWINGLYFINKTSMESLQLILNKMLQDSQAINNSSTQVIKAENIPSTSIRMAVAVIGLIPILIVYPFFQKYFVKGVTLGAVKG